jgi:alkanesulfonate monooxygenase SsuD/methylene tetrahydromethanopterin reductase-like flavin-dependent oxidoreductase (luciferase family)
MPGERPIELGIFLVPSAEHAQRTVDTCLAAEGAGLDLVGIQDHPYQRRYLDTWTLLSHVAGRTERIGLVPDVANLPLRLPSVLAKSVASLDVLSRGRVELGIGGHYPSPEQIPGMQARIDEAAKRAGREPREVRRIVNAMALEGEAGACPDELERVAELGFETILVGVPDHGAIDFVRRLGEETAPGPCEARGQAASARG